MLDNEPMGGEPTGSEPVGEGAESTSTTRRTRTTRRKATPTAPAETGVAPAAPAGSVADGETPPPKATRARRRKAITADNTAEIGEPAQEVAERDISGEAPVAPAKAVRRSRTRPAAEPAKAAPRARRRKASEPAVEPVAGADASPVRESDAGSRPAAPSVLFMAPEGAEAEAAERRVARAEATAGRRVARAEPAAERRAGHAEAADVAEQGETARSTSSRRRRGRRTQEAVEAAGEPAAESSAAEAEEADHELDDDADAHKRRRRGRRGRGRGKGSLDEDVVDELAAAEGDQDEDDDGESLTRRRRRRRRKGSSDAEAPTEDGVHTVVKIREPRKVSDEVQGVSGSTRLEAKRQRRRDGREQRRTRPPILSEAEFLARREAVDRVMVIRQRGDRTQIGVLEDGVLVEHYVTRASSGTMAGNVYLGKVQNVLPSMEAAFVDVGRGRNAVLYAGEVNWDATGLEGRARSIEQALKSGDSVLVQVTKDPIGHKGARLTSHIALSGRHLVYVPHGNASGISRKLPDTERKRLRDILKKLVPDGAGVIVRTAAEGASEDELARDVKRLQAQWEDIQAKATEGGAPVLLYEEPDLVIRVVRDLFNEDFRELVVQGDEAYGMVDSYLSHVSPDLVPRLRRHTGTVDVFAERRIDEQILKALDRKVYLPSGGHLVIDRTEAMTVIDVNTGKYTGAGGNLEETVTRNNLEAAEEIVRQLRLRDLGGILVIDFIDMVLESNRELVLRRLTECLGRDRTKHQVTEITSLGLVQMTRKRIGAGLLEAFSETCEVCKGRGLIIHTEPVTDKPGPAAAVKAVAAAGTTTGGRRRGRKAAAEPVEPVEPVVSPVPADEDDTMGYDLSRYEVEAPYEVEAAYEVEASADEEFGVANGGDAAPVGVDADDVDAIAVDSVDAVDSIDSDEDDETAGAGGARRRSRRGGARRRTRP
ncbi:MAG TPA: Rne/Rng family ribonuclease [Micromonosporaceae bacterium]|nr:Rne/Rng family ribonuclease [Micromonosporaceae bacterium]